MSDIDSRNVTRRAVLATTAAGAGVGLVGTAQAQGAFQGAPVGAQARSVQAQQAAATLLVGAGQRAGDDGRVMTSSASTIVSLTGGGAQLRDMALVGGNGPARPVAIGVDIANATGSYLREVSVDMRGSSAKSAVGFNLTGNIIDHMSLGITAKGQGYTYLTDSWQHGTNTMDGHVLIGFNLVSGAGDSIEYNNPGPALKHSVTWGGILDCGRTVTGKNGGLALGMAHNQGWVAGGLVTRYARYAGVHIEDGSSFGVLSSVALRGCQQDGIWATTYGNNMAEATPIVISSFCAEGPGSDKRGTQGVYLAFNTSGYCNRWPVLGGYVKDFDVGLNLDGMGVVPATSVTVDDCNTVLQTAAAHHYGTLFSNNAATLFAVNGKVGGRAGHFVQSDRAPAAIIANRSGAARAPRSTVDGFAFPALGSDAIAIPAGGSAAVDLFQAPVRMRGRLRLILSWQGIGFFWEGQVCCLDGKTVGVLDEALFEGSGPVAVTMAPVVGFTGSVTGNRLAVSGVASGTLAPGQTLSGPAAGTRILRQLSGPAGGAGSYLVDAVQSLPPTALTGASPFSIVDGKVQVHLYNGGGGTVACRGLLVEFEGTFYA